MTALERIAAALAAQIDTVPGVQGYDHWPGQVNPPAAAVMLEGVTFDASLGGGATYQVPIQLVASLGDWESSGKLLQALMSHDGQLVTALDACAEFDVQVRTSEAIGEVQVGDKVYLGGRLLVEVFA